MFYRYRVPQTDTRAYIFTTYEIQRKVTTNICINISPDALAQLEKLGHAIAKSALEKPLALHTLLASYSLDGLNFKGTDLREELLHDVRSLELDRSLS